jgi:hypothetical protein
MRNPILAHLTTFNVTPKEVDESCLDWLLISAFQHSNVAATTVANAMAAADLAEDDFDDQASMMKEQLPLSPVEVPEKYHEMVETVVIADGTNHANSAALETARELAYHKLESIGYEAGFRYIEW